MKRKQADQQEDQWGPFMVLMHVASSVASINPIGFVSDVSVMGEDSKDTGDASTSSTAGSASSDTSAGNSSVSSDTSAGSSSSDTSSVSAPVSSDATSDAKPACKRPKTVNPICPDPTHGKSMDKTNRQKHTCYKCSATFAEVLEANKFLLPWDRAWLFNRFCRSYCCSVCLLGGLDKEMKACNYPKAVQCKKHSKHNAQHTCAHGFRWTKCRDCKYDVRAGTSFCVYCSAIFSSSCKCPRDHETLIERVKNFNTEQSDEQKKLKTALVESALKHAEELQKADNEIRSTFQPIDTSKLRTIFDKSV